MLLEPCSWLVQCSIAVFVNTLVSPSPCFRSLSADLPQQSRASEGHSSAAKEAQHGAQRQRPPRVLAANRLLTRPGESNLKPSYEVSPLKKR